MVVRLSHTYFFLVQAVLAVAVGICKTDRAAAVAATAAAGIRSGSELFGEVVLRSSGLGRTSEEPPEVVLIID